MSEYAVNRQTGEVLKRDQSGSWQKVKSAKNASGEILINEGGGWGAVPSAQPAAPANPFLRRTYDMAANAQATPPRQPAAWEAGARDYVANMPERERAGILSSGDAALFNIANTLTAGGLQRAGNQVVPGKNLGDAAVTEGESYYPTASVLGRAAGYAVPASSGGKVANMAVQDLITATGARNLVPKAISEGTGALARTARYTGRLGTMAPTGALQVGAYEGIVEQPVRDFMAGEESTVGGRVRAGVNALANPINYGVLPAASAIGRVGKALVTGVATPGDVQRAVTAGSRGAVPLSEGQLAADAAQILDTQAMNAIDPRGFKLVERILRQSGLSDSDIPAVNAKVRELIEAAPDAVASRLTIGQVYAKALYDLDKTQAGENILKVLRERRNVTDVKDRSPSIVGKEVRDLRSSQVDFVTQSAESNLGAGKRIDIKNAVADTKKQIGTEYERVLAEADPTRPEARGLVQVIMTDPSVLGVASPLKRRAINAGFTGPGGAPDVASYVQTMPDAAGHWLRSHLAKAARTATGREKADLQLTVEQLDELLDTNPGYANARKQYGTEIGVDEARDIGSNFITAARNQGNLDLLLEQIAALPARERDVALLAIRDNLLSPVRGSGEDAPARISQLISVGTLEGIERLGPAGKGLADDLRAIRDENQFLGQIDSGNPLRQSATFSNADAAANAPDLYSGKIARTLNAGGGSSLPADIAISAITGTPIAPFTLAKIARSGLQSVFAPGRKSKEAMTQFLMTRPRNALGGDAAPPPQGGADIMPSAGIAPAAERATNNKLGTPPLAPTGAGPISASGLSGLHTDAGNAALGASVGALGPADSPEERLRNMAIGAGFGASARTLDDVVRIGAPRNALADTASAGLFGKKPPTEPPMVLGPNDEVLDLTIRALPDRILEDVKRLNRRQGVRPGETRLQAAERRWAKARKEGRLWDDGTIPDNERVEYWLDELGRRYDRKDEVRKMVGEIYRRIDAELGPDAKGSIQRIELAEKRLKELAAKLEKGDLPPRGGGGVVPFKPIMPGGFGGFGRGPRKPTVGKPKRDIGTKVADATAIGILATGGPTAQADTGDPQQRLEELSQRESAAQQLITEYDQGLKDFQSLSVTEKQIFLRDNGFTGKGGAILKDDGRTGGNTTYAINNYVQKIQEAKAAAQAERELTLNQINQVRVGMAERQENPPNPLFDKAAELATYGAMIYGAHRIRGAATKGSQIDSRRVADDANALLTRLPVPPQAPRRTLSSRVPVLGSKEAARIKTATNAANKAARATEERLAGRDIPPISSNPTSENGLPIRTANLQEFDRRQAAGDFGPAGPIGRMMEPINSRFRAGDLGIIGAGAADAHIMQGMLDKTRADIAAEEERLDKARLAADPDLIQASNDRLEQLRKTETVQTILQRVGVGLMIGGTVSLAHGRYSRPQPRFEAANRERELIRLAQTPTPPPPNALAPPIPPKKPRTVGTQKPKPKPPVSFTRGRPPKAENDND